MSRHENDRHNRADAPDGALSPGSSATGAPSQGHERWYTESGGGPPRVAPSPADPEALVRGQRVVHPSDMDPGPVGIPATGTALGSDSSRLASAPGPSADTLLNPSADIEEEQ